MRVPVAPHPHQHLYGKWFIEKCVDFHVFGDFSCLVVDF